VRLKEFLIFLVIFTVIYILFFVIYDFIANRVRKNANKKRTISLIDENVYNAFAMFYGIQNHIATANTIKNIYINSQDDSKLKISEGSTKYGLTPYEYVVVLLYLEYLLILKIKFFDFENDLIVTPTSNDEILANKYSYYFHSKETYETISSKLGNNIYNDLVYLDKNFLMPGVRFIDKKLYYIGDLNEKR